MIKKLFYSLILIFILIVSSFLFQSRAFFLIAGILGLLFTVLGIYFIILVKKSKEKKKFFLYLTGVSAASILPAVLLHNFVYAIFILLFGENFWQGGDEPVFFILALIIAPIAFIIGVVKTLFNWKK